MQFWSFAAFARDARFAARTLRRDPAFVATAAGSLAVALGTITSVYGIVDAATHPANAVRESERVVYVANQGHGASSGYSASVFAELVRARQRVFEQTAVVEMRGATYGVGSQTDHGMVLAVSTEFFTTTGITPSIGRSFATSDFAAGSPPVAMVGFRVWRSALGAQRTAVGRTIDIEGRTYTIVGVMPPDATWRLGADLVLPASTAERFEYPAVIARLRPGIIADSARAQLRREVDPLLTSMFGVGRRPFRTNFVTIGRPPEAMTDLHKMLLAAAGLIVLVACANLASLMLARGLSRNREHAVRFALGARRSSIVRQTLLEALICSVLAGMAGVVLASWFFGLLTYGLTTDVPQLGVVSVALNWRVFGFAATTVIAVGIASGLYPALRASGTGLEQMLKDGGSSVTRRMRARYSPLVIAQLALTLALLMGAALLLQSAHELRDRDLGLDPRGLLSVRSVIPRALRDSISAREAHVSLMNALAREPGVRGVATVRAAAPVGNGIAVTLASGSTRRAYLQSYGEVSANYLATLGVRLLRGRDLAAGDELSPVGTAVVSRTAALSFWRGEDPIGQMITLADVGRARRTVRVVGIAEDVAASVSSPDLEPTPAVYVIAQDTTGRATTIMVRASSLAERVIRTRLVYRAREALPPRVAVQIDRSLAVLDTEIGVRYFIASVFVTFGLLALALAMFGTFSVRAHDVARRGREFAVRISLGATSATIARSVLRDSVVVALAGTGAGAFLAMYTARQLDPWLYGVFYTDVRALIVAEFALIATTLAASLAPALHAARSNPVDILRVT